MQILRYVTVNRDNQEGETEYLSQDEAMTAAGDDCAVVMRTYEYDDSELVWTPDGSSTWPPEKCSECGSPCDDGEGYDGLCGNCADRAAEKANGS